MEIVIWNTLAVTEYNESKQSGYHSCNLFDPYAYGMVQFCHVFWAIGPSIKGFQYFWPFLSVNGVHLYEKYKSYLLIGVDTDGGLYPLAFAVVEGETKASWQWFISCIYYLILSVYQYRRITFISDRMKKIPNALSVVGFHHIVIVIMWDTFNNFQKNFKDKNLHNLLWEAGCTSYPEVYKAKRVEVKDVCEDENTWIETGLKDQ